MLLRAPEDRKRPDARLNWLLGQLKTVDTKGIELIAPLARPHQADIRAPLYFAGESEVDRRAKSGIDALRLRGFSALSHASFIRR
jgi:hypothetical protein